ncbi:glucan endo-1,3-beta-glucosidase 14-like isoform X2 [Iris pallida]|uniref:glucan endo-1,3-beta-D-glucosidase n=1 Tax=Iris pallida TaxID=29817 RepID=A0AAX6F418_IRIPA|nr:glucan endo-1,3-beta-glucosidase 14-like isoform X2 [Iris pallida]
MVMEVISSLFTFLMLWSLLSAQSLPLPVALKVGINYGQIANNLPTPAQVAGLLQSISISRVKLYDADPKVLAAFGNSDVEFIVSVRNEDIAAVTDPSRAQAWLQQNVQPYLPQTRITCITIGNEVLAGNDTALASNLLPAMQSMHQALQALGMSAAVTVTTAHSLAVLGSSYPPSSGSFRPDLAPHLQPMLDFLSRTGSPFLINAYPYFAYKGSPDTVPLPYVLFESNPGVTDPNTNLSYDNMLYAQIDSVYAAIQAMGHSDVAVRISETGWPSRGDPDEPGATPQNAAAYNRNLLQRIATSQGTPMRPAVPIDVYVFALFNEDLKPGPTSERNYGLFYPDGTPVYNVGLQRSLVPEYTASSSKLEAAATSCSFLILALVLLI